MSRNLCPCTSLGPLPDTAEPDIRPLQGQTHRGHSAAPTQTSLPPELPVSAFSFVFSPRRGSGTLTGVGEPQVQGTRGACRAQALAVTSTHRGGSARGSPRWARTGWPLDRCRSPPSSGVWPFQEVVWLSRSLSGGHGARGFLGEGVPRRPLPSWVTCSLAPQVAESTCTPGGIPRASSLPTCHARVWGQAWALPSLRNPRTVGHRRTSGSPGLASDPCQGRRGHSGEGVRRHH